MIEGISKPDPTIPYIVCGQPHQVRRIEVGTKAEPCTFCQVDILVAPSSYRMAPNAKPICFGCAEKVWASTERPQ